jgi:hypothetical protein
MQFTAEKCTHAKSFFVAEYLMIGFNGQMPNKNSIS